MHPACCTITGNKHAVALQRSRCPEARLSTVVSKALRHEWYVIAWAFSVTCCLAHLVGLKSRCSFANISKMFLCRRPPHKTSAYNVHGGHCIRLHTWHMLQHTRSTRAATSDLTVGVGGAATLRAGSAPRPDNPPSHCIRPPQKTAVDNHQRMTAQDPQRPRTRPCLLYTSDAADE